MTGYTIELFARARMLDRQHEADQDRLRRSGSAPRPNRRRWHAFATDVIGRRLARLTRIATAS